MNLEFHQIDLRYEPLRRRDPRRERTLLASLASIGQQSPAVVVAQPSGNPILVDGFKRLRTLKELKKDTLQAVLWTMEEQEALLLERLMRTTSADSPVEQGWLLWELQDRFSMTQEELARRFDRTISWVSRRLGLVQELPDAVHEQVRSGRLAAHTAMKVLIPLARANTADCLRFLEALLKAKASTREAVVLQAGWLRGDAEGKTRILENPKLFLRAHNTNPAALQADLKALSAVARRALIRAGDDAILASAPRAFRQAQADCQALFTRLEKEAVHA